MPRGTSMGNLQQQNQSGAPALPPTRPVEKFQPKFMSPQHLPSNDGSFSSLPPQERMVKSESWTGISLSHTVSTVCLCFCGHLHMNEGKWVSLKGFSLTS